MILTHDHIQELSQQKGDELCVSLYLPSEEARPHPVALKSLLKEAEKELVAQGMANKKAEALLKPGYEMLGEVWSLQKSSLAFFAGPDGVRLFPLDFPVEEQLFVQPRYVLKPLFWLDLYSQPFYVLAISLKAARLLDCTAAHQTEVEIKNAPQGVDTTRIVEMAHAAGRTGHAAMQSHATRRELQKDIQAYIHQLAKILPRQMESRPVVLAGVDELTSLYRKSHVSEEIPLLEAAIPGNPEETPAEKLRERAWEIVAPIFKGERREALMRLAQSQAHHGNSSVRIEEIVQAAAAGRVETLLLPSAMRVMGQVDPETHQITINSSLDDAIDILDYVAGDTVSHAGKIHLFEPGTLPRPGAIFRSE